MLLESRYQKNSQLCAADLRYSFYTPQILLHKFIDKLSYQIPDKRKN